jgi:arylsulfatase A-like enzyme
MFIINRKTEAESLICLPLLAALFGLIGIMANSPLAQAATKSTPNILFIIMDDVGIDHMKSFGYGGQTPAAMPNIDTLANNGIRFRNNWSMPACSPSRAVFFEGRFPMRSHVTGALGPSDLANSMVSPFDYTAPKILKGKNYTSGLFGKFHLGLQGNNPFGYSMVRSLGWDYNYGWLDETGDPSSSDTTAGGVGGPSPGNGKTYSCGFVPGSQFGGADTGACYQADGSCKDLKTTDPKNPPGRQCVVSGGILNPGVSCVAAGTSMPANISAGFQNYNAHYVSPLDISDSTGKTQQLPPTDKRARTFRGVAPIDGAIDWIKSRPVDKPWMATVSFATDHTPLQPPPNDLLPADSDDSSGYDCADSSNWPVLSNQMIEAMDKEIGRLLVSTGLASVKADGTLLYDPKASNTMIVVVGDNGTLGNVVKAPFDPTRAKGTSYQTGVWVPLSVSGPLVVKPDRDVNHMTNIADIFQLFGEIAGVNVHKTVPWHIDSMALMPYLKNPGQASIRKWNYNEMGPNLQANGSVNGPCVMSGGASCSQIPVTKGVCQDNGGVWWGEGAQDSDTPNEPGPVPLTYCCEVNQWLHTEADVPTDELPKINSLGSIGIRNQRYKVVHNTSKLYDDTTNSCYDYVSNELYEVDESKVKPKIDYANKDLLVNGYEALTANQKRNYNALEKKLSALNKTVVQCDGDGNLDMVVNQKDLDEWEKFSKINGGASSWYDFNLDGLTNELDREIIVENFGNHCKPGKTVKTPTTQSK